MKEPDKKIVTARICPYCGAVPELVDSSVIYGKSYGMIYLCKPCNAYVGVHKGSTKALGRLANKELREAKKMAHHYFDQIAKTDLIDTIFPEDLSGETGRGKAYFWLSRQMNIEKKYCHIGMFDVPQCVQVITICKHHLNEVQRKNNLQPFRESRGV